MGKTETARCRISGQEQTFALKKENYFQGLPEGWSTSLVVTALCHGIVFSGCAPLGRNKADETQKGHLLVWRTKSGAVGEGFTPCYHSGRTLETEAAPCWQCAGPSTPRVPEPSPF